MFENRTKLRFPDFFFLLLIFLLRLFKDLLISPRYLLSQTICYESWHRCQPKGID